MLTETGHIKDGSSANITDPKLAKIYTDAEIAKIKAESEATTSNTRANSEAYTSKISVWLLGISMLLLALSSVIIIGINPANAKDVMLIIGPIFVSLAGLLVGGSKKRTT